MRCHAGRKKAKRRRQCLLFHQVAIATVSLGAAVLSVITNVASDDSGPPGFVRLSDVPGPVLPSSRQVAHQGCHREFR